MNTHPLAAVAALAVALGAAAHAETLPQMLGANSAAQSRLAADAAAGRVDAPQAAKVEQTLAGIYRDEARALANGVDASTGSSAAAATRELRDALGNAEREGRASRAQAAMDRLHVRVAAQREAEQQRWIAQAFRAGKLSAAQVAALERGQADLAALRADVDRRGSISIDDALRVQHAEDVADWRIRTTHPAG